MAKKKEPEPKPKQPTLADEVGAVPEGMAREHHPDITASGVKYRAIRDQRMALTASEIEAKGDLLALMLSHALEMYVDEDAELIVELVPAGTETVKVKKYRAPSADDDGGGE